MLKRLSLTVMLVSSFLMGLLSGISLTLPGRSLKERIEESLGPLLDDPQTSFAPSLREEVFRSLHIGSTQAQVLAALGPPLSRRNCSAGTVCWDYSTAAASDSSHFVRVLVFDGSGRLMHRHMGFVLGD